jgi:zinc transport system substrate-binding protein
MRFFLRLFLITILCILAVAFPYSSSNAQTPIKVFVSILPQKYFVERIGAKLVHVSVMVEPGADPHTYEPKPRQMAELTEAIAYFAIGVNFEDLWLEKIADLNPKLLIVRSDNGIDKIPMNASHGHNDQYDVNIKAQETFDPHVWTSPPNVKKIARNICNTLIEIDPQNKKFYIANLEAFIKDIDLIDEQFKELFKNKKDLEFLVFHPAWGYFAKTYGIKQQPIEVEGKEPKPAQLMDIIAQAKERKIKVIFVQPQVSRKKAETIARAINGRVIIADPLAENWLDNLKKQALEFNNALR